MLVVAVRRKGVGMYWKRKNVSPLLALGDAECNGWWEEAWGQIRELEQHRWISGVKKSDS
jgi:hypothetical protein